MADMSEYIGPRYNFKANKNLSEIYSKLRAD